MATFETNSLGYPLKFKGPDTNEEYDQKAGKVGAVREDACENIMYRSTLPEWQAAFSAKLEEMFGVTRAVNQTATEAAKTRSKTPEKVKDVLETVRVFHNRVIAGATDEQKAELAATAQSIADGIAVDPSPSKRAAGIPKGFRDKAEVWLALPTDQMEAKVTTALDAVEGYNLERDEENKPTVESLARLISQYIDSLLV